MVLLGNTIGYRHDGSETTSDSFTYEASDGRGGTSIATVNVTIQLVNERPVAVDDNISVDEGSSVSGNVLANDLDPDGDSLQVRLISGPAHSPPGQFRVARSTPLMTTDTVPFAGSTV